MKQFFQSQIVATGLAIFSMLFGAGNLIYPLNVGLLAGEKNIWAIIGFLLTGALLPLLGLIAIILFNGDYKEFFNRLGRIPGSCAVLFCILIIGPLVVMPRIVAVAHIMTAPFLGNIPLLLFTILFLGITFLGTYKENRIINLLGYVISPLLLLSLLIIIVKGLLVRGPIAHSAELSGLKLFWESIKTGYKTLDLIGAIFFSSIIITILKKNLKDGSEQALKKLALVGLQAGCIGTSLLALVYVGMSYLGVYHSTGLAHLNAGELFSAISFRILGDHGAIIIAVAVLMACYSTIIALTAVSAEYVQHTVSHNKLNHLQALLLILGITGIIANFGLGTILSASAPFIDIAYPALIVLTLANIAYKIVGFKPVKIPVLVTLIISCVLFFW